MPFVNKYKSLVSLIVLPNLQSILKIERRVGGLESEVRSLRSDMTKMADGRRSGETTTTKPHGHPEVNKEVPDMVELERRLMSKLDVLMTTQGNSSKKINQLVKEVQVLKATDGDMSEKLSGRGGAILIYSQTSV